MKKSKPRTIDFESAEMEIPEIFVSGDFIDNVSYIRSTSMSANFGLGYLKDKSQETQKAVFIPYVSLNILSSGLNESDDTPSSAFRAIMPVENAAYLIWDLSFEMAEVLLQVKDAGTGNIKIEPGRINAVKQLLRDALQKIEQCSQTLEAFSPVSE